MIRKSRPVLFIYDIKEVITLFVFWLIFSSFTFTLGVHFGKQLHAIPMSLHEKNSFGVKNWIEKPPENPSVSISASSPEEIDLELRRTSHEEVVRTGLHLLHTEWVDLPTEPVSARGGATTLED